MSNGPTLFLRIWSDLWVGVQAPIRVFSSSILYCITLYAVNQRVALIAIHTCVAMKIFP